MINKTILIIQNTSYHFETTISLYSSLLRLNPSKLSIVKIANDHTSQQKFIDKYQIHTIDHSDSSVYNYDIAFIISAYPNPHVSINNSIPQAEHPLVRHYHNKTIYVCHRFDKEQDYKLNPLINKSNSIALSPLASNIKLDFFYPIENSIIPNHCDLTDIKNLCVQGHFELKNRIVDHNIFNCSNRFNLNIMGTNINYLDTVDTQVCSNHKYHINLNEIDFYSLLNINHFILPMIDDKIKSGTYLKQRFSTNFNHAMALEKPIFAHEIFKDIYEIPGIYYNYSNINNQFEKLLNLSQEQYLLLISDFKSIKNKYHIHNSKILSNKILSIL